MTGRKARCSLGFVISATDQRCVYTFRGNSLKASQITTLILTFSTGTPLLFQGVNSKEAWSHWSVMSSSFSAIESCLSAPSQI